jgi:hypothetical protein
MSLGGDPHEIQQNAAAFSQQPLCDNIDFMMMSAHHQAYNRLCIARKTTLLQSTSALIHPSNQHKPTQHTPVHLKGAWIMQQHQHLAHSVLLQATYAGSCQSRILHVNVAATRNRRAMPI